MGRTIHYAVEDNGVNKMSDEQWRIIEKLQNEYNAKSDWSCERLCLECFSIFPNWPVWEDANLKVAEVWHRINNKLAEPNGMKELLVENLIEVNKGGYRGSGFLMSGFTKVRGDEHNASLVVKFLLEVSIIAPDMQIKAHDEGDYLKCPVIIQNSQMTPDLEKIKENMKYWEERLMEAKIENQPFWKSLIESHKAYLELANKNLDNSFFISQEIEIK